MNLEVRLEIRIECPSIICVPFIERDKESDRDLKIIEHPRGWDGFSNYTKKRPIFRFL